MMPHCNLRCCSLHIPSKYIVVLYFCLALLSLPATLISLMQRSDALDTIRLWPTLSSYKSLVIYCSIVLSVLLRLQVITVYFRFQGQRSTVLRVVIYCNKRTVKQVIHELESKALPRCLESTPSLSQRIFRPILFICITTSTILTIQPYSYKALSLCFVKVVTLDADDEVM